MIERLDTSPENEMQGSAMRSVAAEVAADQVMQGRTDDYVNLVLNVSKVEHDYYKSKRNKQIIIGGLVLAGIVTAGYKVVKKLI
jgi:hypothetical protein